MMDSDPQSQTVLHVLVVGFHHKKGCQVEYSYPPLIDGNSVESHELPTEWKNIPSLALPDGAHNFVKDTVYFLLPGRNKNLETVYGISCYRQMDAKNLINKTADVTRSTVQKSVCVLSRLPLFGLIKAKLELITHAYFDERDFSQVALLEQTYNNLNSSLNPSLLQGSQVFLDFPVRQLVTTYRHKIVVLFKLLLLERRVLVFGSPVEVLCQTLLGIISLFPGLLEHGLSQACNQWNKTISPTLTPTCVGETADEDQFLEVHYQSPNSPSDFDSGVGRNDKPISSSSNSNSNIKEEPKSLFIPRGEVGCENNTAACNPTTTRSTDPSSSSNSCNQLIEDDSNNASSVCEEESNRNENRKDINCGDSLTNANASTNANFDHSAKKILTQRSCSNDSDKLSVHAPHHIHHQHKNKKPSLDLEETNTNTNDEVNMNNESSVEAAMDNKIEDSPLAHLNEITNIQAVQSSIESINIQSTNETTSSSSTITGKPQTQSSLLSLSGTSTKSLKSLQGNSSLDDLDSPEGLLEIDTEDCFSWEHDHLQLALCEDVQLTPLKDVNIVVGSSSSNRLEDADDELNSVDLDGSERDSLSPDNNNTVNTNNTTTTTTTTMPRSESELNVDHSSSSSKDSPSKGRAGKVKERLSAAFNKKSRAASASSNNKDVGGKSSPLSVDPVLGDVMIQHDGFGHPLAIFTNGSVLYPYLSLQYHDILTDVSTRSFAIGATNVLFKQRRQLIDVLIQIDEGKIEIRDKELQRQLSLTTADLRFAEYLVKTVTEDSEGNIMDGTEWEGSEEWIRAQFKYYINSLLATAAEEDTSNSRLLEDFGGAFISAWKTTHNYRHWHSTTHPLLADIPLGHPFQGNLSVSDVRNRFNLTMQNTERGRKLNAAVTQTGRYVAQTGRVVGGALTSAKSAVSTWFSSWRSAKSSEEEVDTQENTVQVDSEGENVVKGEGDAITKDVKT